MYELLKKSIFFKDINPKNYNQVFDCLKAKIMKYNKTEIISFKEGTFLVVVISGLVDLISDDDFSRYTLHNRFQGGDSFIFSTSSSLFLQAFEKVELLVVDINEIFDEEKRYCRFRSKVLEAIVKLQLSANIELFYKAKIYTQKSLRNKILIYLEAKNKENVKKLNRQELAEFLSCDRAALSRELSKMKKDGIVWEDGGELKISNEKI